MTVRLGRPGDEVAIGEIAVAAWRWAYASIMDPEYLAGLEPEDRSRWWVDTLRSPPQRSAVLMFEVGDEVAGFAAVAPSDDATLGEVCAINVRPDDAGQGYGTALLAACEEQLRSFGFVDAILWVLPENTRARRFYESRGWWDEGMSRRSDVGGLELDQVRYRRTLSDDDDDVGRHRGSGAP